MERHRPSSVVIAALVAAMSGCEGSPGTEGVGGSGGSGDNVGSGNDCYTDAPPVERDHVCADHWCIDFAGQTLVSVEVVELPLLSVESRLTIRPRVARPFQGGTVATDGSMLEVFDGTRTHVGEVALAGTAVSLEVIGDTAFVTTSSCARGDIHTVDLSDPTAPRVTARWSIVEPKRDNAHLAIVGQASDKLVIRGLRSIAYVDVSKPEAPEVVRVVPWPFGQDGFAWHVDVNDQFLVVAGIGTSPERPAAYVYPFGSEISHAIEIAQENTPVLENDVLVVGTSDRRVVVLGLDESEPPEEIAELALPFFDWMPPQHAGFAFLRTDFVVDLRDSKFGVYQWLGSIEEHCVIELSARSGDGNGVAIAPFLAPGQRFESGTVTDHECGIPQLNGIVIESTGTQAIVDTLDPTPLRVTQNAVGPDTLSVEGQIIAWVGDRIVTRQSEGFDFSQARRDTFRVYADDGQGTLIAEIGTPGPVSDIAVEAATIAILAEPEGRAYDEAPSPLADWQILILDFAAVSPILTPIDKPEGLEITRIAIDAASVFGLSQTGELHRWPLDGGSASSIAFVSQEVGQFVATPFGVFASTRTGWSHTDGLTVRDVILPGPTASLVSADGTYVYWHLRRAQAFVGPNDDHIVLARPLVSDEVIDMAPQAGVRVWASTFFVAGQSIVAGWPGLTFYARPSN